MMNIVALFLLLAPGFIAIRILWRDRKIERSNCFYVVCDYVVCSFLVQMMTYGIMWLTYTERLVSFSVTSPATSHILSASFVVKYSVVSLIFATALPVIIPWAKSIWRGIEDDIKKK